jgi:DNA-binding GntR family transcriptional regulator
LSDEFSKVHANFHEELVSACDSPWLRRLRGMLFAQSERYRGLSVPLARFDRDRNREHRELMEAVLARDADRAIASMRAHVETTTRILLDALERDDKPEDRRRASRSGLKPGTPVRRVKVAKAC